MPNILNLAYHARFAGLDDHCRHIAEIIAEFDPDLYIVQLPEGHPHFSRERPFALVHQPPMKEQYVVKTMMHGQVDERLVADLITQKMSFNGTPLEEWEAFERAQEISRAKARQEDREQRAELLGGLIATDGNYAKHNGVFLDPNLR